MAMGEDNSAGEICILGDDSSPHPLLAMGRVTDCQQGWKD